MSVEHRSLKKTGSNKTETPDEAQAPGEPTGRATRPGKGPQRTTPPPRQRIRCVGPIRPKIAVWSHLIDHRLPLLLAVIMVLTSHLVLPARYLALQCVRGNRGLRPPQLTRRSVSMRRLKSTYLRHTRHAKASQCDRRLFELGPVCHQHAQVRTAGAPAGGGQQSRGCV